jgi:hypothetical protein
MKRPTAARPAPAEWDAPTPAKVEVLVGPTGVAVAEVLCPATELAVVAVPLLAYVTKADVVPLLGVTLDAEVVEASVTVARVLSGQ